MGLANSDKQGWEFTMTFEYIIFDYMCRSRKDTKVLDTGETGRVHSNKDPACQTALC